MLSLWQRVLSAVLAVVIFCNTNVLTFSAAVGTLVVATPTYATPIFQEQDELFNRLREQYNTDDPNRNYNDQDTLLEQLKSQGPNQSRDMTEQLQRSLESVDNSENDTLSRGYEVIDPSEALEDYNSTALSVGQTHGAPAQTESGNTKVEYAKESTVRVYRDPETGMLRVKEKDDAATIQRNTNGISESEAYSSQIDHEDTSFEGKDTYGDNERIFAVGSATHTKLKSSSTRTGEALSYQTVTGSANRAINTEIPEQILQPGFNALERDTSDSGDFLNGCTSTTKTETGSLYKPDLVEEVCHDLNKDNRGFCEVERELRTPVIAGSEGFVSCGPGCFAVELGIKDEINPYKADSHCALFQEEREVIINMTEGVLLDRVEVEGFVDDHTRISLNNQPVFSLVWGEEGTDIALPPTGPGAAMCEMAQVTYYDKDVTPVAQNIIDDNIGQHVVKINMDTAIRHYGGHFVAVKFYFKDETGSDFGQNIKQYPEGCFDETGLSIPENIPLDTGAGASINPVLPEANTAPEGALCYFTDYRSIDTGTKGFPQDYLDAIGPFYVGDTENVSWKVNLEEYRCDPFGGEQYCVNDNGEERCFTWDELEDLELPNSCDEFQENDRCSEVSRECIEGWNNETLDICFNEEVEYQCDYGNEVGYDYTSTENTCDSMIPCAGGDCGVNNDERNDRFVEALGISSVMEHIKTDSSCADPNDPSTCRIFEGEYEYCSWEVTGLGNNCCEAPAGVSFVDYINFSQAMMKFDNAAFDGAYLNDPVSGAWEGIQTGASNVYEYFSGKPLTSAAESVVGNISGQVVTQTGEVVSHNFGPGVLGAVQQQVSQFIYDALPDALGDLLFSTAGSGASSGTVTGLSAPMQTAANVFGYIMIAYMVYQLINLAAMLLTQCDENEEDVGMKLEMRQCFETREAYCETKVLGICVVRQKDHCCYSSMLARIVMEQAAPILGKDMGTCSGLTPQELSNLDFNQIDLSEWTATMLENDMVAENTEEGLTGAGRTDNQFSRETATERNKERTDGLDGVNKDARDAIVDNPLDCSVSPRPPVCEYGFDPTDSGGG